MTRLAPRQCGKDRQVANALVHIMMHEAGEPDKAGGGAMNGRETVGSDRLRVELDGGTLGARGEDEEEGTPRAFAFRAYRALADSVCAKAAVEAAAEMGYTPPGREGIVGRMMVVRACAEGSGAMGLRGVLKDMIADIVACLSSTDKDERRAAGGERI